MLADVAIIAGRWTNLELVHAPRGTLAWLQWPFAATALVAGGLILRGLFREGPFARYGLPLAGTALLFATSDSLLNRMESLDPLSSPNWWWSLGPWWIIIVLSLVAVMVTSTVLGTKPLKGGVAWVLSRVLGFLAVGVPRVLGIVLLSFAATAMYETLLAGLAPDASDRAITRAAAAFFASLFGGLIFSAVPNRVSLNRTYRQLLSRCFGVRRHANVVERIPPATTSLRVSTPSPESRHKVPRLLVCATANVRWRDQHGQRRTFAPFIISHDQTGVPGVPNASFDTGKLELVRVPAGLSLRATEPAISLMTAVSMTGAALSPSMGRMTVPAFRPFLASLNIRTGRWLPNPLSRRTRARLASLERSSTLERDARLGGGFNDLAQEMFGLHTADGPRVYVSDGGHYDNLGLLTLLRARCANIWCVDSEADRKGNSATLRQVLLLAHDELGVEIKLDVDRFAASDGLLGSSRALGSVRYPGGEMGRLIVIKLGLTAESPQELFAYRAASDSRFPYHPTRIQAYGSDRVDAYRRLGRASARMACTAYH
jgi:hypothetical protein